MSKVVVTGGAGFVGSHLARVLADRDHKVLVIDDLSTGKLSNIPRGIDFMHGSVVDPRVLATALAGIDAVFHLAAIASVPKSVNDPMEAFRVNVLGTVNILNEALRAGVKKVILASSAAVYGNGSSIQSEDDSPCPLSPYALSKLVGEQYCSLYTELYSLPTVCLRYFNVYGDNMNPKSEYALAVPAFIDRALNGHPLIVYGDGEQTRDFVFIEDVVNASIHAVKSEMQGVYNVGTGVPTSINRLAEVISAGKSQIIHEAGRAGEARHNCASIAKLKSAGFTPKWGLKEGLDELVKREGKLLYASKLS